MNTRGILVGLFAAGILCFAVPAWADSAEAEKASAEGKALLAKGDFDGALAVFKAAVTAEPKNGDCTRQYALLRRVMLLREQIAQEEDSEAWMQMARALIGFYREHQLYTEALPLAASYHEKVMTGDSAALLAEVQLGLNKNEDAAASLGGLDAEQTTPRTQALRGVALARLGKLDEAKAIADGLKLPKDCDDTVCIATARLYARLGDHQGAFKMLQCALECTSPRRVELVRAEVRGCADFATLRADPAFSKVLATKSKMKAGCGGCSGAQGCAKSGTSVKAKCGGNSSRDSGCSGHQQPKKK